jgi:hypothetical protein
MIGKNYCTIGKKFWFSNSGSCTITGVGGREKKRAEERLRACRVLDPEEEINEAVEEVSFDDVKDYARGSLLRQRTINRKFVESTINRRIVGS